MESLKQLLSDRCLQIRAESPDQTCLVKWEITTTGDFNPELRSQDWQEEIVGYLRNEFGQDFKEMTAGATTVFDQLLRPIKGMEILMLNKPFAGNFVVIARLDFARTWVTKRTGTKPKVSFLLAVRLAILVGAFLFSGLLTTETRAQFQPPTTVQLPVFGVAIDAEGVFTTPKFAEAGDPLFQQRAALAKAALPADVFAPSKLRKISLRKLNAAIAERLDNNEPLDDVMQNLAGLIRIQYVFIVPDKNDSAKSDIVIAGPAEGWLEDAARRNVGVTSGRPTILLDDLVVALRAYGPNRPIDLWVGCSINPQADSITRLSEFNRSVPSSVPERARGETAVWMVEGMREALGLADVVVYSISAKTGMAQVLIEADYRMKMIAVGLEAPPIRMPTFFSLLKSPPKNSFQRWWFTPNYDMVKLGKDRMSLEIVGDEVKLLTEDYGAGKNGQLMKTGKKISGPAKRYATAFSKDYDKIAAMSPVFQQLRNMVDVLVVAAYLQKENAFEQIGLEENVYQDDSRELVRLTVEPTKAPCVANAVWKGSRLIAVAGGGVSIQANQALKPENLIEDKNEKLQKFREQFDFAAENEKWWWD